MQNIQEIKTYLRSFGTDVNNENRDKFGEVFTPTDLVNQILDRMDPIVFSDPDKTFLDHSCGNGQFLSEVLIRKLENGIDFETALGKIYGVDINQDNVDQCRERLLCGCEKYRHIVEQNIVCHDALIYDYSFNGTNKNEADIRFDSLFEEV
jgi:type I restriction-modification system DNA methylase subunit